MFIIFQKGTKYIYIQGTIVSVPSSELGPSKALPPLSQASVSPHPELKGVGTHSPAGEGVVNPIRTTGERDRHSVILCEKRYLRGNVVVFAMEFSTEILTPCFLKTFLL
jgi:hypothetical protein